MPFGCRALATETQSANAPGKSGCRAPNIHYLLDGSGIEVLGEHQQPLTLVRAIERLDLDQVTDVLDHVSSP